MAGAEGDLVKYHQTPATRFYACRECGTHIALSPDCIVHKDHWYIILKNPINLKTDTPENYSHSTYLTLANVNCSGCNTLLGKEVIRAAVPLDILREGYVALPLYTLLFRNGNEML